MIRMSLSLRLITVNISAVLVSTCWVTHSRPPYRHQVEMLCSPADCCCCWCCYGTCTQRKFGLVLIYERVEDEQSFYIVKLYRLTYRWPQRAPQLEMGVEQNRNRTNRVNHNMFVALWAIFACEDNCWTLVNPNSTKRQQLSMSPGCDGCSTLTTDDNNNSSNVNILFIMWYDVFNTQPWPSTFDLSAAGGLHIL